MSGVLLFEMLSRISMAIVATQAALQAAPVRRFLLYGVRRWQDRALTILILSALAIFSRYTGLIMYGGQVNSSLVFVMLAGILGGVWAGSLTGALSGFQHYWYGGFTDSSCMFSAILAGIVAGGLKKGYGRKMPLDLVLAAGLGGEGVQILVVIFFHPYGQVEDYIWNAGPPMALVNAAALVFFVLLFRLSYEREESVAAKQSRKALLIAHQTLPYLRGGLREQNAAAAAEIIFKAGEYSGVVFTNRTEVLACKGLERCYPMQAGESMSGITWQVLQQKKVVVAQHWETIGCRVKKCRLGKCCLSSVIVVPLLMFGRIAGTLQLYHADGQKITSSDRVFAGGLGQLFTTQLELAETDQQRKLAELMALHLQIQPHFLFNTLNTVASFIRTDPELARKLLLHLSELFRFSLQKAGRMVLVQDMVKQARHYLAIAEARNGKNLRTEIEIAPEIMQCALPSLCIQPLLENSLKHGLHPRTEDGWLHLSGSREGKIVHFIIEDNGVGMEKLPLLTNTNNVKHIGLCNVQARLTGLYGEDYGLQLESTPGKGTRVHMRIPYEDFQEAKQREGNLG